MGVGAGARWVWCGLGWPQKAQQPIYKVDRLIVVVRDVLLSHAVARAVPSALEGLTSGFGM